MEQTPTADVTDDATPCYGGESDWGRTNTCYPAPYQFEYRVGASPPTGDILSIMPHSVVC
jgi:hypothetical protein